MASFAHQVELIRKDLGQSVSGTSFAKKEPQLGLVRSGGYEGITIAVLNEGTDPSEGYSIVFHRYDQQREMRLRDYLITVEPAHFQLKGEMSGSLFPEGKREPARRAPPRSRALRRQAPHLNVRVAAVHHRELTS